MKQTLSKKKRIILLCAAAVILLSAVLALLLGRGSPIFGTPTLTVETPQKLSADMTEPFTLDVGIDHLGEALYPAASMSLTFDPSRLEFLGVGEGNVFILDAASSSGQQLPQWSYSVDSSNETGRINIMYLDMTGGAHAFSQELLAEEDNVVLRLQFRLRGSVRAGDVLDIVVEDAVFAASDETESLAMTRRTLNTRSGKIVMGG